MLRKLRVPPDPRVHRTRQVRMRLVGARLTLRPFHVHQVRPRNQHLRRLRLARMQIHRRPLLRTPRQIATRQAQTRTLHSPTASPAGSAQTSAAGSACRRGRSRSRPSCTHCAPSPPSYLQYVRDWTRCLQFWKMSAAVAACIAFGSGHTENECGDGEDDKSCQRLFCEIAHILQGVLLKASLAAQQNDAAASFGYRERRRASSSRSPEPTSERGRDSGTGDGLEDVFSSRSTAK